MKNAIPHELNRLLSDYQVLYQKLRNYHWNVKGPQFFQLHTQFMTLYEEAALRVDELAERILALGERPLSTLKEQLANARLREDLEPREASSMVRALVADYEALNSSLREGAKLADQQGDQATLDLLSTAADAQEKTVWMLRAYLG